MENFKQIFENLKKEKQEIANKKMEDLNLLWCSCSNMLKDFAVDLNIGITSKNQQLEFDKTYLVTTDNRSNLLRKHKPNNWEHSNNEFSYFFELDIARSCILISEVVEWFSVEQYEITNIDEFEKILIKIMSKHLKFIANES